MMSSLRKSHMGCNSRHCGVYMLVIYLILGKGCTLKDIVRTTNLFYTSLIIVYPGV